MPPLVSVLLPVFNSVRLLPACMDSILAQTLSDFEVIAVDDGAAQHGIFTLFNQLLA